GVFFDTMLVCTATAIMILLYSGLKFGEKAPQGDRSYTICIE
ncbi:alanine:cation symporter family protein, partial [Streptococcus pneumoniae]